MTKRRRDETAVPLEEEDAPALNKSRNTPREITIPDSSSKFKHGELSVMNGSTEPMHDIISGLIDMNLHNIVEKIFSHLNEAEVASAVTANSKWWAILTSRRCAVEQFFKGGTLKTLYRRRVYFKIKTVSPMLGQSVSRLARIE